MLHGLSAPTMTEAAAAAAAARPPPSPRGGPRSPASGQRSRRLSGGRKLRQQAADRPGSLDEGAFGFAKKLLTAIYNDQTSELGADKKPKPARPIVVQRLALATYKAGEATGDPDKALAGYAEAEKLPSQLDVETTTDPDARTMERDPQEAGSNAGPNHG